MDATRTSGLTAPTTTRERPAAPLAATPPPRVPEALGDRFAAKLADLKGKGVPTKTEGQPEGTQAERPLPGAFKRVFAVHERRDEEGHELGGQAEALPVRAIGEQAAPTTHRATALAAPQPVIEAAIERMAAAVAELRDSGAAQVSRVDFPQELQAVATGAVVARDAATGALAIRVFAAGGLQGANRRLDLEDELRRGLERRRLRIATVSVEMPDKG